MKLDIVSLCVVKILSDNQNKLSYPVLDRKVYGLVGYSIDMYLPRTVDQLVASGLVEDVPLMSCVLTKKGQALITEETDQWIHAILTFADDKTAKVLCPKCQSEYMNVTDSEISDDETYFNRHVSCNKCGACDDMKIAYELFSLPKGK